MKIEKCTIEAEERSFYFDIMNEAKRVAYYDTNGIIVTTNASIFKDTPINIPIMDMASEEFETRNLKKCKSNIIKSLDKTEREFINKLKKKIKNPDTLLIIRKKICKDILKTIKIPKLKNNRVIFVTPDEKSALGYEQIGFCVIK